MTAFKKGEIRPISAQGRTTSNSGINIYGPQTQNNAIVNAISINNGAAYNIEVYRYSAATGLKILLYALELAAGDIILDTRGYRLNSGDYIYMKPTLGAVNFTVEGFEYEDSVITPPFASTGELSVIDKNGKKKTDVVEGGGGGEVIYVNDAGIKLFNYYNFR